MSWRAEVIRTCVWGMSRFRKDLVALEYRERRVASVLVVELELVLVLGPGLEIVVVVEDMGEVRGITCPGVGLTIAFTRRPCQLLG
jgi:hypothetical protein